ncbi:MAG: ABC transporter substrate-binding protein [Burkholderiaceae bacterium]
MSLAKICLSLLLTLLAPSAAISGQAMNEPLVIGVITPRSGPNAPIGIAIAEGAAALVDWVNAHGGVRGRPIELIQGDDHGDAVRTIAKGFEQVDQHLVRAFLAPVGCASTYALLPLAERLSIPVIAPMCGDRALRRPVVREAFPIGPGHDRQAENLARLLISRGTRHFALVLQPDALGDAARDGTRRALGASQLPDARLDEIRFDASAPHGVIEQLRASDAEVILTALPDPQTGTLSGLLRDAGMSKHLYLLAEGDPLLLAARPDLDMPAISAIQILPDERQDSIVNRACLALIGHDLPPLMRAARRHGCLATQILIAGLRRSGDDIDDPQSLIAALERPARPHAGNGADPFAFTAFDHQAFQSTSLIELRMLTNPMNIASIQP